MNIEKVLFAAGCFWGVQYYFDEVPGVVKTTVGYSGGHTRNPSYWSVASHRTGHAEVTLVEYDPKIVKFETLVRHFFRLHDPTQLNRQGPDIGDEYRSAIFYYEDEQKRIAEKIRDDLQSRYTAPIVTQIAPATEFYIAEADHQKFTKRTGIGMCHARYQPING